MKLKATLFLLGVIFITNVTSANNNDDCRNNLSLFAEQAKIENYEGAFPYLKKLREECPKSSLSIYQYGERIYKSRIEKASEAEKMNEYNEYKKLMRERLQNFPESLKEGAMLADFAQVMFDNKIGTPQEQFDALDSAYKKDKENFTSPKALYTYFSLGVDLYENDKKPIQEVFDLYDELINKVEEEENSLASRITPLIEKQDAGTNLEQAEERLLSAGETNLRAYSQVKGSVNGKLGILADCTNLIPLYSKDFDEKNRDIDWLKAVNIRLSEKECTEDPLFVRVSQALHDLEPSARSAYSLGLQAEADGKSKMALDYFNQSAELETDNSRKANIYYKIGENYRKAGNSSQARNFYRRAIDVRPSFGRAYLQIANMYAASSNNCGETVFEKRAINWLAADLARTAARVDPSVASNANAAAESYTGRAPSKSDIFQAGMQGKTVTFNCWVGGSVKVPNL